MVSYVYWCLFKWGVTKELIGSEQLAAMQTVPGLRFEKSQAKESEPREPVAWAEVEKIFDLVSPVVADMLRVQWHTGCRPQQVCTIRPCEVDTARDPWTWTPGRHKGTFRGHVLTIFLGPTARRVLEPYLDRAGDSFCFSPREAKIAQLKSKGWKVKSVMAKFGLRYKADTYQKAVLNGIAGLGKPRIKAPFNREKFATAGLVYWTPHQIRHSKGTEIREQYGIEAAQAMLGHASLSATQIYAKKRMELAREIAEKTG